MTLKAYLGTTRVTTPENVLKMSPPIDASDGTHGSGRVEDVATSSDALMSRIASTKRSEVRSDGRHVRRGKAWKNPMRVCS